MLGLTRVMAVPEKESPNRKGSYWPYTSPLPFEGRDCSIVKGGSVRRLLSCDFSGSHKP